MSDRAAMVKCFEAFLEAEEKPSASDTSPPAVRLAQIAFWSEMRRILAVKEGSTGLDVLDDVATAIIDTTGDTASALVKPVFVLPAPASQTVADGAPAHAIFGGGPKSTKRAPPAALLKSPKGKKPKTSGKSQKKKTQAEEKPTLDFTLAPSAPAAMRAALEGMYAEAARTGKLPYQLAYPWADQALWYDPAEFPDVHLAHWRSWMACRRAFFEWALHVPLASTSAQTQRRKRKMAAMRERLAFVSFCIESWGYYGLLRRLEGDGNGHLMSWGGQTGLRTAEAKGYEETCLPVHDLLDLYEGNGPEYRRKIRDALKPFKLDAGSFSTLPELLEKTGALDPDAAEYDKRLSDTALARIAMDAETNEAVPDHWVPTKTDGVWYKLLDNTRIRDLRLKVEQQIAKDEYEMPVIPSFDEKEVEGRGFEPFRRADGSPTALGPVTPYTPPGTPSHKSASDGEESAEDVDEEKEQSESDEASE